MRDPRVRSSNEPVLPIADHNGEELPGFRGESESEAETVPYDSDGDRILDRADDEYESADEGVDSQAYLAQVEEAWKELLIEGEDEDALFCWSSNPTVWYTFGSSRSKLLCRLLRDALSPLRSISA